MNSLQSAYGRSEGGRPVLRKGHWADSPQENGWHGERDDSSTEGKQNSEAMQDIYYLNSLNQTVVAAWDLQDPDPNNPSKRSRQRSTEKIGIGGDRRNKVSTQHIQPGGRYRAICKLFMGFTGSKEYEYMGTGWLIENDIVVTAAHCLYDSGGGYLRSIKVYIGYEGPEDTALGRNACEMRLGKIATIPAEYIKTGHTVHDVGFIKLEEPFHDVEPFKPEDTPKSSDGMKLGVVGYPGDIEGGNDMYEHWDMTAFDLAENGFLSYKIDTEVGESGSPVLREVSGNKQCVPIGVHTDGGYPNSGSVIGPLGNSFGDYTTAIKIKQTHATTAGATRMPVPRQASSRSPRNLEYISIPAAKKATTTPIERRREGDSIYKKEDKEYGRTGRPFERSSQSKEAAKVIADLEHRPATERKKPLLFQRATEAGRVIKDLEHGFTSAPRKKKELGKKAPKPSTFMVNLVQQIRNGGLPLPYKSPEWEDPQYWNEQYLPHGQERSRVKRTVEMSTRSPRSLPHGAYKESGPLTGDSQDALIRQADERIKQDSTIKTKFFLDFPPKLEGQAKAELKKAMRYVQEWQCWINGLAGLKSQQQVNQGKLTNDASVAGSTKRSNYENMVIDHLTRQSPWVSKTFDQSQTKVFKEKMLNFHTALIKAVIDGFTAPKKALEDLLHTINDGILKVGSTTTSQQYQYFIMLTKYDYEPLTETVQPSIRIISFETDSTVKQFVFGKSSFSEVNFTFNYHQYECNFNTDLYEQTKGDVTEKVIEAGRKFSGLKIEDIDLAVAQASSNESMRLPFRSRQKQSASLAYDLASYDTITESITQIADLRKYLKEDELDSSVITDILNCESVDAAVATFIGIRLGLQGQKQLKEITPRDKAEVLSRFPRYWQFVGALVFKQLFPDEEIPAALSFYTTEQEIRSELQSHIDEQAALEKRNESLQHTLDEANDKLDSAQLRVRKLEVENEKYAKELGCEAEVPGSEEEGDHERSGLGTGKVHVYF